MNSQDIMARAKNAVLMRDYPGALELAELLIEEYSENPELHLFIGNIYSRMKEHNKAIQAYQRVIELDPENPEAHNNIGVIYRYIGNIPAAIGAVEHALRVVPGRADILYNLGNIYKQIDEYPRAIEYYNEAIKADPQFLLAYNNWGTTLQKLGQEKEAEQIFRKGLEYDENHPTLLYNLGISLQNQKRDTEAVTKFRHALKSAPAWEDGLNNLGVSLERTGQAEQAYSVFKRVLSVNPAAAKVKNNMAVVLGALGRDDEAAQMLKDALEKNPSYKTAAMNLEVIQEKRGEYNDAFVTLRKLLEHDRDNLDLRLRFATVCLELKKLNLARESIAWLVERHPRNNRGYALLGRYQELTGKRQEAVMSYVKALNLQPNDNDTRIKLAFLYKELRDYGKAIAQTSQILSRDEENYAARLLLGKLYLLETLYKEALTILDPLYESGPVDEELLNALIRGYKGIGNKKRVVELTQELIQLRNTGEDLDLDELDRQLSMYEESLEEFATEHEAKWEENLRKLKSDLSGETEKGSTREGDSLLFEHIPDLDRPAPIIDIGGIEPVIGINEDEDTIYLSEMEEEIEDFEIEEKKKQPEKIIEKTVGGYGDAGGQGGGYSGGQGVGGQGSAQSPPFNLQIVPGGGNFQVQLPSGLGKLHFTTKTTTRRKVNKMGADKTKSASAANSENNDKKQAKDAGSSNTDSYNDDESDVTMIEMPENVFDDQASKDVVSPEEEKDREVHLFDYLQGLINYLPDEQKQDFETSEVKLKMEAIKEKLKGHGGLFSAISREDSIELSTPLSVFPIDMPKEEKRPEKVKVKKVPVELSKENIGETLSFIQDLSVYHPNKEIGVALHHKIADIVHTIRKKNGST